MKIGYLSVLPPPGESANSGVYKVSETLLREFEKRDDCQVHAVTLIDGLSREVHEKKGAVDYHYLPCRPTGKTATLYLRETARLRSFVRSLGVDVVHGQPTSEYLLAAAKGGLPSVLTIHGLVLREMSAYSKFSGAFWANWIREMLQRRAVAAARHIISISPYVDEYLSGRTRATIHPISNPIDPEFFDVGPVNRTGLRLLCVGIVSARKNQKLLVEACGKLRDAGVGFECRIVGKQDPAAAAEIGALIEGLRLAPMVRLCGIVSREELLASYEWSNAVVLPSKEETAPLSLIQGMAAGRAVFGARAAGIPHLFQDGKRGDLFDPDSPGELAATVGRLALPEAVSVWSRVETVSRIAKQTYHPATVAQTTVDLYRSIAAGRGSVAAARSPGPGN